MDPVRRLDKYMRATGMVSHDGTADTGLVPSSTVNTQPRNQHHDRICDSHH